MTDPKRILDENPNELGALLVRAGMEERAPARARRDTLVALGLAVGTTAVASTISTGLVGTKSIGTVPLLLIGKWAGVGVIVGGLAVGGAVVVESVASPPRKVASAIASASMPSEGPPPQRESDEEAPVPPVADSSEAIVASTPAAAVSVSKRSPVVVPSSSPPIAMSNSPIGSASTGPATSPLAAELALVDGARLAMRSGNAAESLRLLELRDAEHPRGVLGIEATVLRIEALVRTGDRRTARELGRSFLDRHPNSPLAPRVRAATGLDVSK